MKRKHFIAALLGLSMATSGLSAAPAHASDNTGKIIAGVATLAIIGTAIAKSKSDDHHHEHATVSRHKTYSGHAYKPYKKKHYKKKHRKSYGHKSYKKHYGHKSYKKGYGYSSYKKRHYGKSRHFKRAYAY